MSFLRDPRRRLILLLSGGVLVLFVLLGCLQAFNTSGIGFLNPETSGETLAFTGLTVIVFLALMTLLMLLLRNVLRLYADQSNSPLGARLRTRMVIGATLIALMPAVFMFLFSYLLMNRSLDRWFSRGTAELREDSSRVVMELTQYLISNARAEADSIVTSGAVDNAPTQLQKVLDSHRATLAGGFAVVFDNNQNVIASFQAPAENTQAHVVHLLDEDKKKAPISFHGPFFADLITVAQRMDAPVLQVGTAEYAIGKAETTTGKTVVVAMLMPEGLSQTSLRIRTGAAAYRDLMRSRQQVRTTFFLMLLVVTAFVFFSSIWLALYLSKQITRPVEALADAMDEIADGKYEHRVALIAGGEMGELVQAFNHMAADLDASRQLAVTSTEKLSAANLAIEGRRRELETIIETIPSGVVTLDAASRVMQSNRAFQALLGLNYEPSLEGWSIARLFPTECVDDLEGVMRRGQRMGAASMEIECRVRGRIVHMAVTSARLELGHGQPGTVLVMEDSTELLRAQRQLAWKEVAQRVAHEIKNPLTPIALSAERITRHLDRNYSDSQDVIRKCSEVILGCVGTLRTLVDQFSALAQFPASQPRYCNLNQVAEEALLMFSGRLEGITISVDMDPNLPQVMADPEAIRRALANLIDNAAEAMQGSLLRELGVQSAVSEDGAAVEITVSDTGHGLTDEIRERLFLPFYSTKHRGTGLGLSIAAKIVQEHGGSIRAEGNTPKGARFVLRLPLMEAVSVISAADAEEVKDIKL